MPKAYTAGVYKVDKWINTDRKRKEDKYMQGVSTRVLWWAFNFGGPSTFFQPLLREDADTGLRTPFKAKNANCFNR
jgi:hypothetical protein